VAVLATVLVVLEAGFADPCVSAFIGRLLHVVPSEVMVEVAPVAW